MKIDPSILKLVKSMSEFYRQNESLFTAVQENQQVFGELVGGYAQKYHEISVQMSNLFDMSVYKSIIPILDQLQHTNSVLSAMYQSPIHSEILETVAQQANYVTIATESFGLIFSKFQSEIMRTQASITASIQPLVLAQQLLQSIPWPNLGGIISLNKSNQSLIQANFSALTASLHSFVDEISFFDIPLSNSVLNSMEYASKGYYKSADLVRLISIEEDQRIIPIIADYKSPIKKTLEELLESINPNLVSVLNGFRQAEYSTNSDSLRHFVTSGRELFREVIHHLAPIDEIRKWNKSPDLYSNGRPIRKARLQFICQNIDTNSFPNFLDSDIEFSLDLFKIFNKFTHAIGKTLDPRFKKAIRLKLENQLRFYIELSVSNSN